jgi:hypothetical protein
MQINKKIILIISLVLVISGFGVGAFYLYKFMQNSGAKTTNQQTQDSTKNTNSTTTTSTSATNEKLKNTMIQVTPLPAGVSAPDFKSMPTPPSK